MKRTCTTLLALAIALALAQEGLATGTEADAPDWVTVKGQTLRGRVVFLDAEALEFESIYGSGALRIPLEDIEAIGTRDAYRVYFGESDETVVGRLQGVEAGQLVVGADPSSAEKVPLDEVRHGVSQPRYEKSFFSRLRSNFRDWNLEVDLGFNFEQGAVEKRKLRFGGQVARRRNALRLSTDVAYAIDVQTVRNEPQQTTKNEFIGSLLVEYDLFRDRLYTFGLMGGDFDRPRRIEGRIYPTAGLGWRVYESERALLTPMLGFGWVLEDFRGLSSNNYAALFFGLEGGYEFGNGITLGGRARYWPSLVSPGKHWLFRTDLWLTIPLWDPLALKWQIIQVNDNNPEPNVGNNKLELILGLSLRF